ncbi:MAG: porin [Chitinophagales bacterium]|nr:porin [Saprospiraceae bacterium]
MHRFSFVLSVLFTLGTTALFSQTYEVPEDSLQLSFKPYGSFRGHFAFYNDEIEMQENGSRVGFEFGIQSKNIRYFAGSELQLNMFKSDASFNASTNTSGGFLIAEKQQERQVFATRLGYIGADLHKWGSVSLGKQWGVYYDITSYTDKFNVFGGQASATYVAGTDGGAVGTGRADQSLLYRNKLGPVSFGAQIQARTGSNGHFLDGFGFSAQVDILEGLKAGAAFNQAYLVDTLVDSGQILGLTDQPGYFTVGASYTSKRFDVGAVYAIQTNGDVTKGYANVPGQGIVTPSVVYDASGIELYGKLKFEKINLLGGYNYYNPDTEDISLPTGEIPISSSYVRKYIVLGLEYKPLETVYFYTELRISSGKTVLGTDELDVLTVGAVIDVERMITKTIKR